MKFENLTVSIPNEVIDIAARLYVEKISYKYNGTARQPAPIDYKALKNSVKANKELLTKALIKAIGEAVSEHHLADELEKMPPCPAVKDAIKLMKKAQKDWIAELAKKQAADAAADAAKKKALQEKADKKIKLLTEMGIMSDDHRTVLMENCIPLLQQLGYVVTKNPKANDPS